HRSDDRRQEGGDRHREHHDYHRVSIFHITYFPFLFWASLIWPFTEVLQEIRPDITRTFRFLYKPACWPRDRRLTKRKARTTRLRVKSYSGRAPDVTDPPRQKQKKTNTAKNASCLQLLG